MVFQQKWSSEIQKHYKTNGFNKNGLRKTKNMIKPMVFQQKWSPESKNLIKPMVLQQKRRPETQKPYKTNGFPTKTKAGDPKTL